MTDKNSTPKMRKYVEIMDQMTDLAELLDVTLHPEVNIATRKAMGNMLNLRLSPEEAGKEI